MTRDELHAQKLLKEAEQAHLQLHTRRHFLKESAMGLGALAI
ncbi:twin-arginine translocation signal domain-containing protein, partial [Flavihumibacter sediminis]|nr:twin-arginine translocation signal domain-containing protein [Flavihumibacter sediminis]